MSLRSAIVNEPICPCAPLRLCAAASKAIFRSGNWRLALALAIWSLFWSGQTATAQDALQVGSPPDKVLYLTFDDGPSAYTQEILDLLAQYDAKATFFVIGRAADRQPELIEAIYAAGHGLGNHTYSHPSLRTILLV